MEDDVQPKTGVNSRLFTIALVHESCRVEFVRIRPISFVVVDGTNIHDHRCLSWNVIGLSVRTFEQDRPIGRTRDDIGLK